MCFSDHVNSRQYSRNTTCHTIHVVTRGDSMSPFFPNWIQMMTRWNKIELTDLNLLENFNNEIEKMAYESDVRIGVVL